MVTRYVNTASTAGGNGTTNDIVGANRAFATLSEAESALRTLNAADDLEILCCGAVADSGVSLTFWNSNNYITNGHTIYVNANRSDVAGFHGGKWNTSTYIRNGSINITTQDRWHFVLNGIQMLRNGVNGGLLEFGGGTGTKTITITNCLFNNTLNSEYERNVIMISYVATGTVNFINSVFNSQNLVGNCLYIKSGGIVNIYNCGFTGARHEAVLRASGTVVIKNSFSFNNVDDFYGTATIDHCASDDGDGTNPIAVANWADQFHNPNYAAEFDFSLTGTSVLLDAGIGPDSDANVPTTDILAYDRSGLTATVGAFEHEWDWSPVVPSTSNEIQFFGQLHGQLHGQE